MTNFWINNQIDEIASKKQHAQQLFYNQENCRNRVGIAKGILPELNVEAFEFLDDEIEDMFPEK